MEAKRTSVRARAALVALVAGYVLLDLIAGVPGSPLVPPLPEGAEVPSWSVRGAELLWLDGSSRRGLTVLALAVLVLLLVAFAVVVHEAWRGRVALVWVLVSSGASLLVATAGPVMLSRDVHSYAIYGRTFAIHGSNPYVEPPSAFPADPFTRVASEAWIDTRSVYGPAFTLLSSGVAGVFDDSPGATIAAFKVLAGTAMAAAVLLVARAARRLRPGREALAAAALGLNPVIVVHTVGGGHNDALVAALLAGALVMAAARVASGTARPFGPTAFLVTCLLSLAALVKAVLIIPLLPWVWILARPVPAVERLRVLGGHLGLALLLAVALFLPFLEGLRSLNALFAVASLEGWASGPALVARGARELGEALAGADAGEALARAVSAAFLVSVALVLARLAGRISLEAVALGWGVALLLFALGAPYLLPWYAAWFLPFLFLMGDDRLAWIGLASAGLLALTGVPAEPGQDRALYDGMRLVVHYAVAPIMLALFVVAVRLVGSSPLKEPPLTSTDSATPLEREIS